MSYLYFIRHASEPRFKIGRSLHPFDRSKCFGEDLAIDRSLQVNLGRRSSGIEKGLQALFDQFRLEPTNSNDGATEWFRIDCWDQCLAFFELHADLLEATPEPIPIPAPTFSSALTAEQRALRRTLNRQQRLREIGIENCENIGHWDRFLQWFEARQFAGMCVDTRGSLDIEFTGYPVEECKEFALQGIGRCFLLTETGSYSFGVGTCIWAGEDETFIVSLSPLSEDAIAEARAILDPDLLARFESINEWIAERAGQASSGK